MRVKAIVLRDRGNPLSNEQIEAAPRLQEWRCKLTDEETPE